MIFQLVACEQPLSIRTENRPRRRTCRETCKQRGGSDIEYVYRKLIPTCRAFRNHPPTTGDHLSVRTEAGIKLRRGLFRQQLLNSVRHVQNMYGFTYWKCEDRTVIVKQKFSGFSVRDCSGCCGDSQVLA